MAAKRKTDPRLQRLSEICLDLPEAARNDRGSHSEFRVRKRPFAYFLDDHHGDGIVSVCVKMNAGENAARVVKDPDNFYIPAYIGAQGWIGVRLDRERIDWSELRSLIHFSYLLAAPKSLVKIVLAATPKDSARASSRSAAVTIDDYLDRVPAQKRAALQKLRQAIRAAAPGAEECLSYQLPAFKFEKRILVAFGAAKDHCALYPMSSATVTALAADLKQFETSKGTIRFSPQKPLSAALIKKLIKARIAEIRATKSAPAKRTKKVR